MDLTKNERRTLKLLLANSRVADSEIAQQLKISSQAVGKIRRKLEADVIRDYSTGVDFGSVGIETFAVALACLSPLGLEKGYPLVESILRQNPHMMSVFRLTHGSAQFLIVYGFESMSDMEDYFRSSKHFERNLIQITQLYPLSHRGVIKNSAAQLIEKLLDKVPQEFEYAYPR